MGKSNHTVNGFPRLFLQPARFSSHILWRAAFRSLYQGSIIAF